VGNAVEAMDMPFFPGRKLHPPEPLAVFLPPFYEGVGAEFLRRLGKQGKRVVDPFGQSPALALELARNGAALLVAASNPVIRALLALQADPPPAHQIRALLARLARSSPSASSDFPVRPTETLEAHIRSLYVGTCAFCGRDSEAEGFIWASETDPKAASLKEDSDSPELLREPKKKKSQDRLVRRICNCPSCGHTVEEPATPADEERMPSESSRRMMYTFALERLAPLDDWYRSNAAEALDVYPSRSVYALFLILTRLELLNLDPQEKRCADLLLLTALDEAHILRGHAHYARVRPRSLQPPVEYREVNIWRVIEKAADDWSLPSRPVPIRKWRKGEALEAGTISTYAGNVRELAPQLPDLAPDFLISFLPRPNPAAWTLSAMWADWLWGRSAAGPLAGALHRRRYDWNWHARALTASALALAENLPSGTPVATFLGESEPPFFAAALWAFYQAGFSLNGRALRPDTECAQLLWSAPGPAHTPAALGPQSIEPAEEVARLASRQLVSWRAEPTPLELLHAAAWSEALHRRMLQPVPQKDVEKDFSRYVNALSKAVEEDPEIRSTPPKESETGQTWWLPGDETLASPLSDQVEVEAARILQENGPLAAEELDGRICTFFPGLLTPDLRLLHAFLDSYGLPAAGGAWVLRPEDHPASREGELLIVREALRGLGKKMGYTVNEETEQRWTGSSGEEACRFLFTSSAAVGRLLLQHVPDPKRAWIVLPGSRAPLVLYKLRRNVLLRRAVNTGWRFLKFRHIRRLLEDPLLRPETMDERFGLDPLGTTEDKVPYL
jgi:hypothetical protein